MHREDPTPEPRAGRRPRRLALAARPQSRERGACAALGRPAPGDALRQPCWSLSPPGLHSVSHVWPGDRPGVRGWRCLSGKHGSPDESRASLSAARWPPPTPGMRGLCRRARGRSVSACCLSDSLVLAGPELLVRGQEPALHPDPDAGRG